jgi:hypothetical protein
VGRWPMVGNIGPAFLQAQKGDTTLSWERASSGMVLGRVHGLEVVQCRRGQAQVGRDGACFRGLCRSSTASLAFSLYAIARFCEEVTTSAMAHTFLLRNKLWLHAWHTGGLMDRWIDHADMMNECIDCCWIESGSCWIESGRMPLVDPVFGLG